MTSRWRPRVISSQFSHTALHCLAPLIVERSLGCSCSRSSHRDASSQGRSILHRRLRRLESAGSARRSRCSARCDVLLGVNASQVMNAEADARSLQVLAAQRGYGRPGPSSPEMSIAGNSWSRCLSFRKAIWAVGLLLACCASSRAQIPGTDDVNQTKLYFKNNLAAYDQLAPHSNACGFGAVAQGDGYIINVASWAEQAGLHRGDRIKVHRRFTGKHDTGHRARASQRTAGRSTRR